MLKRTIEGYTQFSYVSLKFGNCGFHLCGFQTFECGAEVLNLFVFIPIENLKKMVYFPFSGCEKNLRHVPFQNQKRAEAGGAEDLLFLFQYGHSFKDLLSAPIPDKNQQRTYWLGSVAGPAAPVLQK